MQLQTNSERRELKSHGSWAFPVFISNERVLSYERGAFSWHWHPEIELTLFLEGEMEYQVNDRLYHFCAGQGLFCNRNALHTGHTADGGDCRYLSVTFHPRMIYGFEGSAIERDFVAPILQDPSFGSLPLTGEEAWERDILEALRQLRQIHETQDVKQALTVERKLLEIWDLIYTYGWSRRETRQTAGGERDVERIRAALDYLHGHYAEHVTLEEVADQMNLCRSESCRFFRKYMKQSVFDYLQNYRVEKSLGLLAREEHSITEVALMCGFASPAYFTKIFRRQMKCTPMVYRKNSRKEGAGA